MKHTIALGHKVYTVEVEAFLDENETTYFNLDSLNKAQIELSIDLLTKNRDFDPHLFNFVLNVTGQRASVIAPLCESTASAFSQARREDSKPLGPAVWKLFRYYMMDYFSQELERLNQKKSKVVRSGQRLTDKVMHPDRQAV